MEKFIRDGKVAVLYSPGFGAGWSTWIHSDDPTMRERSVFDPELVEAVLSGDSEKITRVAEKNFPDEYSGGLRDIEVWWADPGTAFTIEEYDGSESIRTLDDLTYVA